MINNNNNNNDYHNNHNNHNNKIKKHYLMFYRYKLKKTKMKTYCLKCKKDIENIDPKVVRTKNNRLLMQSICSDCKNKKSRLAKEQDAKGLLSNLGINTPFSKIPLLNVLF